MTPEPEPEPDPEPEDRYATLTIRVKNESGSTISQQSNRYLVYKFGSDPQSTGTTAQVGWKSVANNASVDYLSDASPMTPFYVWGVQCVSTFGGNFNLTPVSVQVTAADLDEDGAVTVEFTVPSSSKALVEEMIKNDS